MKGLQTLFQFSLLVLSLSYSVAGHNHPNWQWGSPPPPPPPGQTPPVGFPTPITTRTTTTSVYVPENTPTTPAIVGGASSSTTPVVVGVTTPAPVQVTTPVGGYGNATVTPVASNTASAPAASGSLTSSGGQVCINWSGSFYYRLGGGFADASTSGKVTVPQTGTASQLSTCWPNVVTGGRIAICENACIGGQYDDTAKYTLFECTWDIANPNYSNCDMSIVDGFSLPVKCSWGGQFIGGSEDLNTLATCPTVAEDQTCSNTGAYVSYDAVTQYFKNGLDGVNNNYCNYQTCYNQSDAFWNMAAPPTIQCDVGTSKGAGAKKRDLGTDTFEKRDANNGFAQLDIQDLSERTPEENLDFADALTQHVKRELHGGARQHARALKGHV